MNLPMNRARLALVTTSVLAAGFAGWLVYQVAQPDVRVLPLRLCLEQLEKVIADPDLLFCTHGPDPVGTPGPGGLCVGGVCPFPLQTSRPPPYTCIEDGVSGDRIQVFYATAGQPQPDYLQRTRDAAAAVDALFASQTQRHYRFVCESDQVSVKPLTVKGGTLSAFIAAVNETRIDRFYLGFGEFNGGWATGSAQDESRDPGRHRGPQYSIAPGWGVGMAVHELGHNLGAVALSAPHSTGFWHCWDEADLMCYDDGGSRVPPSGTVTVCSPPERFDCRNDDYFSDGVLPRWNLALSTFIG